MKPKPIPTDAELSRKLAAARIYASDRYPYFSQGLFALSLVREERVETMAVDCFWRCYWCPDFVAKHSVAKLAAVLVHELMHLLRDHAGRCFERDPLRWNIAADLEINDDITHPEMPLPNDGCFPARLNLPEGLTAEVYYTSPITKQIADRLRVIVLVGANPCAGKSGSCATGVTEVWELGEPGSDGCGKDGITPDEAARLRRQIAKEIIEARDAGRIPDGLRRWADEEIEPVVNWLVELAALVRYATTVVRGKTDYTRSRPSRRQSVYRDHRVQPILPALVAKVPRVAVAVDTSASMGAEYLEQGLAEVNGLLKALGYVDTVTVLSVDAKVQTCQQVFSASEVQLFGGGGTDMGEAVRVAAELSPQPEVGLVVFTDGYTDWPAEAPVGMQVVVCCCTPDGDSPEWARTVRVPISRKPKLRVVV